MTVDVKFTETGVNDPSLGNTSVSGDPNDSMISKQEAKDTTSVQTGQNPDGTQATNKFSHDGPPETTSSKASGDEMSLKIPALDAPSDGGESLSTQGKTSMADPASIKKDPHAQLHEIIPANGPSIRVDRHCGGGLYSWYCVGGKQDQVGVRLSGRGYLCPAPEGAKCGGKEERCQTMIKKACTDAINRHEERMKEYRADEIQSRL